MTKKKDSLKDVANKKPTTAASEPAEEAVVSDEQLEQVNGGLNPQPLPPRVLPPVLQEGFLSQVSKIFRR